MLNADRSAQEESHYQRARRLSIPVSTQNLETIQQLSRMPTRT